MRNKDNLYRKWLVFLLLLPFFAQASFPSLPSFSGIPPLRFDMVQEGEKIETIVAFPLEFAIVINKFVSTRLRRCIASQLRGLEIEAALPENLLVYAPAIDVSFTPSKPPLPIGQTLQNAKDIVIFPYTFTLRVKEDLPEDLTGFARKVLIEGQVLISKMPRVTIPEFALSNISISPQPLTIERVNQNIQDIIRSPYIIAFKFHEGLSVARVPQIFFVGKNLTFDQNLSDFVSRFSLPPAPSLSIVEEGEKMRQAFNYPLNVTQRIKDSLDEVTKKIQRVANLPMELVTSVKNALPKDFLAQTPRLNVPNIVIPYLAIPSPPFPLGNLAQQVRDIVRSPFVAVSQIHEGLAMARVPKLDITPSPLALTLKSTPQAPPLKATPPLVQRKVIITRQIIGPNTAFFQRQIDALSASIATLKDMILRLTVPSPVTPEVAKSDLTALKDSLLSEIRNATNVLVGGNIQTGSGASGNVGLILQGNRADDFTVQKTFTAQGGATFQSNVTFQNALTVTGTPTFSGSLVVSSSATSTFAGPIKVAGFIQSSSGGFIFPDGSIQTVAGGGGGGSGTLSSLNGLTGATQTFVNDTNITITSSGSTHTLGFSGNLAINRGGTGAGTFTSNGVLYGNGTSALLVTAQGAANSILPANAGAPSFSASPTIGTSLTTPLLIGGTGTTSTLTLKTTTGVGASGADLIFQVGSNGGTEAARILNSGNVGIGTASPSALLHLTASSTTETLLVNQTGTGTVADFQTNGTSRLFIAKSGNVGIGTASPTGTLEVNSTSANAFVVGANGATNPAFQVDASAASSVTGLRITSAASGAGVTLTAISSAATESLTVQSKASTLTLTGSTGVIVQSTSAVSTLVFKSSNSTGLVLAATTPNVIITKSGTGDTSNGGVLSTSGNTLRGANMLTGGSSNSAGAISTFQSSLGNGTGNLGTWNFNSSVSKQASGTTVHTASTIMTLGSTQSSHPGTAGALLNFPAVTWNDENTAGSGTAANANMYSMAQSTLTARNTSVISTDAATLYIAGAPTKSTNMTLTNTHGLLIAAGAVTATNGYGLSVNAPTGATNNYTAQFMGGNVGIGTATPGQILDVSGSIRVSTLTAASATTVCRDSNNDLSTCSSSSKFKDNISYLTNEQLQSILNDITSTRLASFSMKTDHPEMTRFGIIAEEAPLSLRYIDEHQNPNIDFYSAQLGYTWAGIKALSQKINLLEDRDIYLKQNTSTPETTFSAADYVIGKITSQENTGIFKGTWVTLSSIKDTIVAWVLEALKTLVISIKGIEIGSPAQPGGITIYDRATGEPRCVFSENGILKSELGKCGDTVIHNPPAKTDNQQQTPVIPAPEIPVAPLVIPAENNPNLENATSTN